ncbi:MAG: TIGR00366 family protein [Clostridiales bacterium]|nr:TIGR00366 family protein [Clostridiales bacterium]
METTKKQKKKIELPHVYTIAFALIILFAILTWIIPSGQFERTTVDTAAGTREVAVAGSYHEVEKIDADGNDLRQGVDAVLMAPTRGIQNAADVVAFVLLIGGTFAIITKTNAINAGMNTVIKKLKNKDILIIPIVMTLLSLGGTSFGMSEEALPFYAIFMPIMMGLGYDSMTAFMICFLGPQVGYCASTVNPFNVLIAQGVAGIEGNPQLWFRMIQWVIFTVIGIAFVMMYARRVKKNPTSSITYHDDIAKRKEFAVVENTDDMPFTLRQKLVLLVFIGGLGIIVWGLITKGWYMDEISMVFLGIGLLAGILGGLSEKEMANAFVEGLADFAYAAVIIGIARGILVVAEGGMIIDTILNSMATALAGVPTVVFTSMMYVVQSILTILIPSSSGLAALTIPIMAPLTELMGVNPEASVTCLQYANQVMNTVSPTAGMTVAGLAVCKISFPQWWKTCWKFVLLLTVLGLAFTAISGMLPV